MHCGDQFWLRVFSRGLGSSRDLYHVIRDDEMICVMRVISNVKVYGRPLLNSLGNLCLTIGILWSSVGFNTQIIYHLGKPRKMEVYLGLKGEIKKKS